MNSTSRPASITSPVISWPSTRPGGRRGPAADHVLVAAADVRGNDLEDHAVVALARPTLAGLTPGPSLSSKVGVVNVDQFDFSRPLVGNGFVPCHRFPPAFTDPALGALL